MLRTVAEPPFYATQMRLCNVSLASAVTFGRIAGASAAARALAARQRA